MGTEVSRRVWKGSSPGSWKLARGQVTSGRKSLEVDETGDNERCSIITRGVNYVALGGFSRLYRQAVEETGVHNCLSAPTMDTVTTLR